MATSTDKRNYWDFAAFSFFLLLSAGNIADQLGRAHRSNLSLLLWSVMAVNSLVAMASALRPRPAKDQPPATD